MEAVVERDGVELRCIVRAGEPTVVLLHGLAGHAGEWSEVIDQLDPSVGAIAVDLRAHGRSQPVRPVPLDAASHVTDVVAVLEALSPGPVVLCGQSMGGIVATLTAAAHPDLVDRLVLVESGMEAIDTAELDRLAGWLRSWPAVFADTDAAAGFFSMSDLSIAPWTGGLRPTGAGLARRFDPEALVRTITELGARDRWEEWASLRVPATLLVAEQGMIGDDEVERMGRLRPDVDVVVIGSSGHDVHLDRPAVVARHLVAPAS
ncbi:MAG: alpha/beta hydrolase [Actinomycetota bacterium]